MFNQKLVRLALFLIFGLFLSSSPRATAQLRNHDAFFGYSRTGYNIFYQNTGGLNGLEAALQIHLHPFFGMEGDVAHYGLGASSSVPRTTTVLAGPRTSVKAVGINLFVHGLVGGEHSANGTNTISGGTFVYDLGGGVDFPIAPFFAWRFSADRLSAPTQSPGSGDPARFNTGLVFRF